MRGIEPTVVMTRGLVACAVFGLLLSLQPPRAVAASDLVFAPQAPNLPDLVGLGVGLVPDYEGSDDYTPAVGPLLRLGWDNRSLLIQGNQFSSNIIDHEWFRFGPAGTLRFERNDVDDDAVDRLETVDTALELGLTVGFEFTNEVDPRIRFTGDVQMTYDVLDAHGGVLTEARLRYWYPIAKWLDFSIGGGVTYASEDYNDTYFGVSANDSARSGLRQFSADGGFKDVKLTPLLVAHFSESWHVGGGIMYKRLLGDAADSPVVDDRGSAN